MLGVHVMWTAPRGGRVFSTRYEFLTAMLSALCWKKFGTIMMVTDNTDFFNRLDGIYDEVRELGDVKVCAHVFWAAGKLYAMRELTPPFCMVDTDLVVWKKPEFREKLAAIHEEEIGDIYLEYGDFFRRGYSRNVKPVNGAFTYINDSRFLKLYTDEAIGFMEECDEQEDTLCPMIFAEQRMFSMCAERIRSKVEILATLDELERDGGGGRFTHLWGYKRRLEEDADEAARFEERLINRIKRDFPEHFDIIKEVLDNDF